MTKQHFQSDEVLRNAMREATKPLAFLSLAMIAADGEEEKLMTISVPTDLARDALRNAERIGALRYKNALIGLAEIPDEKQPKLTADYRGRTPFDEAADIPVPGEDTPT